MAKPIDISIPGKAGGLIPDPRGLPGRLALIAARARLSSDAYVSRLSDYDQALQMDALKGLITPNTAGLNDASSALESYTSEAKKARENLFDIEPAGDSALLSSKLGSDFPTFATEDADNAFTLEMGSLKQTLEKDNNANPTAIVQNLYRARAQAKKAAESHFKAQSDALVKQFEDSTYQDKLWAAYQGQETSAPGTTITSSAPDSAPAVTTVSSSAAPQPTPAQSTASTDPAKKDAFLKDVQDKMQKKLKAAHKNNLEQFTKNTENAINSLHEINAQERAKLLFFYMIVQNNKHNLNALGEHAKVERAKRPTDQTAYIENGTVSLAGLNPDDLEAFTYITGNTVKATGTGDKKRFDITLSSTIGPKTQGELDLLAMAVRANGNKTIKLPITHSDPKQAVILGRQAYDAAINAGFDPKSITIEVNTTAMDLKALQNADHPALKDKPKPGAWAAKTAEQSTLLVSMEKSKKAMKDLREKELTLSAPTAPTATSIPQQPS